MSHDGSGSMELPGSEGAPVQGHPSAPVRTWADGFGRWYAEVPYKVDAAQTAREAIEHELDIRGERFDGYDVTVEQYYRSRAAGTVVYREAGQ